MIRSFFQDTVLSRICGTPYWDLLGVFVQVIYQAQEVFYLDRPGFSCSLRSRREKVIKSIWVEPQRSGTRFKYSLELAGLV